MKNNYLCENHFDSWSNQATLNFYSSQRCSLNEIYDSERFFLLKVLKPNMKILDIGCAAGGFSAIFREIEPSLEYTGIDVSTPLVQEAVRKYSDNNFIVGSGSNLPFKDEYFDLVFCSGVLHMTLNWREIIRECWRVTRNLFIFDVRLVEKGESIEDPTRSYQKLSFNDQWDGKSSVPYIILTLADFLFEIKNLNPSSRYMNVYGYLNEVSKTAITPYNEVCMSMWSLNKKESDYSNDIWMIPFAL